MRSQPILGRVKEFFRDRRAVIKGRRHHFHAFGKPRIKMLRALELNPKPVRLELLAASDVTESAHGQVVADVIHFR